jgi:dolichol-phosphate mannosyltransferase
MQKILTIIIPCYNEEKTIKKIIQKVLKQEYIKKQIIVVDDKSSDDSIKKILLFKNKINKIIFHNKNKGKGACIRSAQMYVKGDIVIIQDADLEYDPQDYKKLIDPIIKGKNKVVYGSRVLGKSKKQLRKNFYKPNLRVFGNFILTKVSNFLNNQKLTDAHTCYKVFESKLFKSIKLQENDFAFCPEITSIISKKKVQILELPIKYKGRSVEEGKKINLKDALRAFMVLLKHKLS